MNRSQRTLLAFAAVALAAAPVLAFEALPDTPPVPANNPITDEKVELGKMLYMDPRLSSSGTVSCNSCHNVMAGGDDSRPNSVGVGGQTGGRGAPTVYNAAFLSVQFWDGRAPSLEEQAKGPITNPIEMGMASHDLAVERLRKVPGYHELFEAAFGDPAIDIDRVAKAIATYERTLITPNGPFDRYLGGDTDAISAEAIAGSKTFESVGCPACHMGPAFAGPTLPEGTGFFQKFPTYRDNDYVQKYDLEADTGRHDATGDESHKHMWRVPTLRNVALTAPYFHNGKVKTLDEAVRVMAKTQLNKDLTDQQVSELVAFLESLTGEFPEQTMPRLPSLVGASLNE